MECDIDEELFAEARSGVRWVMFDVGVGKHVMCAGMDCMGGNSMTEVGGCMYGWLEVVLMSWEEERCCW